MIVIGKRREAHWPGSQEFGILTEILSLLVEPWANPWGISLHMFTEMALNLMTSKNLFNSEGLQCTNHNIRKQRYVSELDRPCCPLRVLLKEVKHP